MEWLFIVYIWHNKCAISSSRNVRSHKKKLKFIFVSYVRSIWRLVYYKLLHISHLTLFFCNFKIFFLPLSIQVLWSQQCSQHTRHFVFISFLCIWYTIYLWNNKNIQMIGVLLIFSLVISLYPLDSPVVWSSSSCSVVIVCAISIRIVNTSFHSISVVLLYSPSLTYLCTSLTWD